MNYLYLIVDLGAVFIPFLFSFHPRLRFIDHLTSFLKASFLVAIPFVIWDIYFTKWGVWGFNSAYLSGLNLFNLPIEELLFFFLIPYACVFTWHCLKLLYFNQKKLLEKFNWLYFVGTVSLILSLVNYDSYYTFSTFLLFGIINIFAAYRKLKWMHHFYWCYGILLIPFTIVNGILTGTGIEAPIVWYNPLHHLGPRLLSIPLEDIFYGLSLIFLNVFLFEYFEGQKKASK